MQLGMIGLGKMGGNMALRLLLAGIEVAGFNRDAAATESLAGVYAEIDRVTPREVERQVYRPRDPLVHWPAGAVVVLAIAFYVVALVRKRVLAANVFGKARDDRVLDGISRRLRRHRRGGGGENGETGNQCWSGHDLIRSSPEDVGSRSGIQPRAN